MKIALVNPYPCSLRNSGGVEAVIHSLHTELNKMDIESEVISVSEDELRAIPSSSRLLLSTILLNKLLWKKDKFDIIHAHAWAGGILPFIRGKPKVMTAHGTTAGYLNRTWNTRPFKNKWYNKLVTSPLEGIGFRSADRITAVSESTRQEIVENHNIPKEKITVVHHGIDIKEIHRLSDEEIGGLRNKLGHDYLLFFMGRLMEEKGLIDLIWAVKMLDDYDIQLVITGKGAGEDSARKVADSLDLQDKVLFIGEANNLRKMKYLSVCDAFVAPSHSEAFGLTLLEAMACRTPIVTTNVSSMPEVIGDCGVLVQPANPYALARGISRILDDKKNARILASRGYERMLEKFTIRRMANSYVKIYEEAVE